MNLTIGELSRQAEVKIPTIRYYEQIGLMAEPVRTEGQQRRYGFNDVRRLNFIRHARELGFEVEAIRQLLDEGQAGLRARGQLGWQAAQETYNWENQFEVLDSVYARLLAGR